jgi:hypothetical protein
MSSVRVLGVNDDTDFCAICGKKHLKRVVWLELEDNTVTHAGTSCAVRLIHGWPRDKKVPKSEEDRLFWEGKVLNYARKYYHNFVLGKLPLPLGVKEAVPLTKQLSSRFGVSSILRGSILQTNFGTFDLSKEPHDTAHAVPKLKAESLISQVVEGANPRDMVELASDGDYRKWTVDELDRLPIGSILIDKKRRAIIKVEPKPKEVEWHPTKEWKDYDIKRKQPFWNSEWYNAKYVYEILQRTYPMKLLA